MKYIAIIFVISIIAACIVTSGVYVANDGNVPGASDQDSYTPAVDQFMRDVMRDVDEYNRNISDGNEVALFTAWKAESIGLAWDMLETVTVGEIPADVIKFMDANPRHEEPK